MKDGGNPAGVGKKRNLGQNEALRGIYEEGITTDDEKCLLENEILPRYHYEPGEDLVIQKIKSLRQVTLGGYEVAILRSFALYGVLEKDHIRVCVNESEPDERKKPGYDKEIGILTGGGYLFCYSYRKNYGRMSKSSLKLYVLSQKGGDFLRKRGIRIKKKPIADYLRFETPYLLETASFNDWHLCIMETYKDDIRECMYQHHVRVLRNRHAVIPSYFALYNPLWDLAGDFTLLSIPCPKIAKEGALGAFLNQVMAINAYAAEHNLTNPVMVLVADSFRHAVKISRVLYTYPPLEDMVVFYAISSFVKSKDPLSRLLRIVTKEDGSAVFSIRNLTKRITREEET